MANREWPSPTALAKSSVSHMYEFRFPNSFHRPILFQGHDVDVMASIYQQSVKMLQRGDMEVCLREGIAQI